jgi:hypothetical protein
VIHRILAAAVTLLLAITLRAETLRGTWTMLPSSHGSGRVQLNVNRDSINSHMTWGETMPLSAFEGLSASTIASSRAASNFVMRRDAGTFEFEGTFRDGEGAGHFTFVPNASYLAQLRSMNVRNDEGGDENELLFRLAMHDVSADFIRSFRSLGYDAPIGTYIRFRIHGVDPRMVTELRALGYTNINAEDLVRFRIHGVSPELIRALAASGYRNVPAEDLVRFRIHGVSPEFIRDLASAGYRNVPGEDLVRFRIHGVSSDFVRDLASLGYRNVPAEDLVRMRIHGVTPQFIREVEAAGYHNVPVEKLVSMKIHGIDGAYLKGMSK